VYIGNREDASEVVGLQQGEANAAANRIGSKVVKIKMVLLSVALGCSVGLLADARIETTGQKSTQISFGVGEAAARSVARHRGHTRRVARRTLRRTSRRVSRRYSALPAACPFGGAYYYCGGVYYQPVVENGTTTYVIVTP